MDDGEAELDLLIARHVFLWTGLELKDGVLIGIPPGEVKQKPVPPYSKDDKAADLVVEAMWNRDASKLP